MIPKLLILLFTTLLLWKCDRSAPDKWKPRSDTARVVATFVMPDKSFRFDAVYRIIRDTIMIDSTLTVQRVKDTGYFVPRDSAFRFAWPGSVTEEHDVDSALAELSRWVKQHPEYFKKDTTLLP